MYDLKHNALFPSLFRIASDDYCIISSFFLHQHFATAARVNCVPFHIMTKARSNIHHRLTAQQKAIIASSGNLRINAVAGSGKTTTLIEYAASRPSDAQILYLAFNKSVKREAERRFTGRGLTNVEVQTAHSLAFRHVMRGRKYVVKKSGSYKTHEIASLLQLKGFSDKHTGFIIANHINKFMTYFCNSRAEKVQQLNYIDTVDDDKAAQFVRSFYRQIEQGTREILAKMNAGEIEIIHDFYLKLFQLSAPRLRYDYILFDEAQDASPVMLDILLKQDAKKIIVGDTHQQIYTWRYAVNAMASTPYPELQLTDSFRFPQVIADLAGQILGWKTEAGAADHLKIAGKGNFTSINTKATIARSNLGLLYKAIEYITSQRGIKGIYFEGNLNSYTYADDGTSLYDVLYLYNGETDKIKDPLISSLKDFQELEEYVEKTGDGQLGMMIELVQEYRNEIFSIIKKLKSLQVTDEDRNDAEMIFSTVHKAKGLEYDVVHLATDFITEEKWQRYLKLQEKKETDTPNNSAITEEVNLLYVAITRTRNKLYVTESMLPKAFPASPHIIVSKTSPPSATAAPAAKSIYGKTVYVQPAKKDTTKKATRWTLEEKRQQHQDAYKPWDEELDSLLLRMYHNGAPLAHLAEQFGRTRGAIISRLKKLNVYDD